MSATALAQLPPAYAAHAELVLRCVNEGTRPPVAPPARFATLRNPARQTLGPAAARMSIALGEPFMPWQQQVADVALELDPDRPGCFYYTLVIITVPRQSGKTTLMRAIRAVRAVTRPYQVILMTAQTGKDARKQWSKLVERAQRPTSPLAPFVKVRQSQGSEALAFPNGSAISPFAPTPKSVHGDTTHLWDVDEGWAFGAEDGGALIDALDPTQITVRDRQAYVFSTQGTAASEWWNDYVDRGRLAVADPRSRVAYFEWASPTWPTDEHPEGDPDGQPINPHAPETVASFHPAVGHTQQLGDLMDKADGPAAVWRRAYLNLRSTKGGSSAIDVQLWGELGSGKRELPADRSQLVLGYAVAGDRSGASVWAAWPAGGKTHLQLVASDDGAAWLPPTLLQLQRELAPRRIVANDGGLTRNATTEARRLGVQVEPLGVRDYTEASTGLVALVADGELTHDGTAELAEAIEVAVLSPMGGSRGFDERKSAGPIDHLQAALAAAWAAEDDTPTIQLF